MEQKVDHFNSDDNRTFHMRYYENREFLKENGPIFLYVGGEWSLDEEDFTSRHIYDMARNFSGILFYNEHRYYGESYPTEEFIENGETYHTVNQSLADIKNFIDHVKSTIPEIQNSSVILVGASYSANLVTWFMQKYPGVASGAWASSSSTEVGMFYSGYMENVSNTIEHFGGKNCTNRVRHAMKELEKLIESGDNRRVEEIFHLCDNFNSSNRHEVRDLFDTIEYTFGEIIQYGYYDVIEVGCTNINHSLTNETVDEFGYWWLQAALLNDDDLIPGKFCYDHLKELDEPTSEDLESWVFQLCSELGTVLIRNTNENIFSSRFRSNETEQLEDCIDFDERFTFDYLENQVKIFNSDFNGKHPKVQNVFTTQGEFDPWISSGITEDINESSPTYVIPGSYHCSDLQSISEDDSEEVVASKLKIFELVKKWVF